MIVWKKKNETAKGSRNKGGGEGRSQVEKESGLLKERKRWKLERSYELFSELGSKELCGKWSGGIE